MASRFFALLVLLSIECGCGFSLSHTSNRKKYSTSQLYSSPDATSEKTFANYVIYKSKAAVALKVIPPTFQLTGKSRTVLREGGLLFEFANCSGPKEYDWAKKGTFLLAAAECGELLLLDTGKQGLEFFHDPNMGGESAGQITKKFKLAVAGKLSFIFSPVRRRNRIRQAFFKTSFEYAHL